MCNTIHKSMLISIEFFFFSLARSQNPIEKKYFWHLIKPHSIVITPQKPQGKKTLKDEII